MSLSEGGGLRRPHYSVIVLCVLAGITVLVFFLVAPALVEGMLNRVLDREAIAIRAEVQAFHDTLFVADLHADSMLWGRNLLARGSRGHVDIPRLAEGGVALQVFSAVTRSPVGQNYDSNPSDAADMLILLAFLQRWPAAAWSSPKSRALTQAERLHDFALRSGGRFRVIESRADLRRFEADRRTVPSLVAGVLAIEGLHALEGDLANLEILRHAGYRMMGIAHFFDNEVGGSAHGTGKGGLTELGRAVVARMQSTNVIVDLAHASAKVIEDVLAMSTRPVVVSHTGVRGTCEHVRNLSDDQLRGIAATGGVIGIGYWDAAVCEPTLAGIVRGLVYAAKIVGPEHIALGSDYDGSTEVPFDTSGVPMLTQGLLDAGLAPDDVRKIMGENVRRVLQQSLP